MRCYGDLHVFSAGANDCGCGHWKQGVAPKPNFYQQIVIAYTSANPGCTPEAASRYGDQMEQLSKYRLNPPEPPKEEAWSESWKIPISGSIR